MEICCRQRLTVCSVFGSGPQMSVVIVAEEKMSAYVTVCERKWAGWRLPWQENKLVLFRGFTLVK